MAEAKKTPKKTPVAADKRKAADDALEARIAARKASAPKTETVTITEGEALPFVPDAPKAEKPAKVAKEKKVAKPREVKPKAEVPAVSDLVAKIEAKVSARIEKVHNQQLKATNKNFLAEVKRLNTEHKAALKALAAMLTSDNKSYVEEREKKAYAAGFKAGEKAANKAITAALKGR